MSGKGCRNYENFLQLNEETWFDFLSRKSGVEVNINLKELICNVYVSPYAPNWFYELVQDAMLQMIKDYPNIKEIVFCLDHDAAGIEACQRLAEISIGHADVISEDYVIECFDKHKKVIESNLKKFQSNKRIMEKYEWCLTYHNEKCMKRDLKDFLI